MIHNRLHRFLQLAALALAVTAPVTAAGALALTSAGSARPVATHAATAPVAERKLSLEEAKQLALKENPEAALAEARYKRSYYGDIGMRQIRVPDQYLTTYGAESYKVAQRQAEAARNINEVGRKLALEKLKTSVEKAYMEVLKAELGIEAAQAAVRRAEEQLRVSKAALAAGTVAKSDVLAAEVNLAQAQTNLNQSQRGRQAAAIALNQVLGIDLRTPLVLTTRLARPAANSGANGGTAAAQAATAPQPASLAVNLEEKIAQALQYRPELVQARENLAVHEVDFSLVQKYYTPSVDRYLQVELNLTEARVQLAQQQREIEAQVRRAYINLQSAEERLQTLAKSVEQARENHRLATLRYQAGMATQADVLAAEGLLVQTETQEMQALYDYNAARLDFDLATAQALVPAKEAAE